MYLIDGNNLMSLMQERKELLRDLANFVGQRKVRVSVVFDGAPEPNFPDGSTFQGVKIFYAERNSDADTRIKHIAENAKDKNSLRVVTDDRALANYVRGCAVKVISCQEFRRKMNETSKPASEKKPFENVKKEDVSEWMRYFGVDENDDLRRVKKPAESIKNESPISAFPLVKQDKKKTSEKKSVKPAKPAKLSRKMKKKALR